MCAPEIRSNLDRPDYWVECRPCGYRSEDYLNLKDVAAAFAWHCADSAYPASESAGPSVSNYETDACAGGDSE